MSGITAHCLIKNEENFVGYAIKSVINFVDSIIVFDTGSTDKTVEIIQNLVKEFPKKIIFEEKGLSDKARHTQLRQEMIERTKTDWFMILDGDEVWTKYGLMEAREVISGGATEVIESWFFECVGDVYHTRIKGGYKTIRFVKTKNVKWIGQFGVDNLYSIVSEEPVINRGSVVLNNKFWHLTHLIRSAKDMLDFSSGTSRGGKRILTYFLIGKKIKDPLPKVFENKFTKMSFIKSFINFFIWIISKRTKIFGQPQKKQSLKIMNGI